MTQLKVNIKQIKLIILKDMFLVVWRTLKQGLVNFWRNGWLSLAATSVLMLSLYTIGVFSIITISTNQIIKKVESKIDVSIYFKSDTKEEKILEDKKDLENYQEIKSVKYISKDQALVDFKKNNANEPVIMESLKEIGDNPLLASLIVKANNPNQYQTIVDYVNKSSFKDDISRINYEKNRDIIDNLNNIINQVKKIGFFVILIFGLIAILIIFNTVRIAIYSHRQEIEVMRLVGASNMFIRLPFIFEGILYGVIASLVAMGLLFISIKSVAYLGKFSLISQNLLDVYWENLGLLFGIQIGVGVLLGIISSWIAMRKYLKI
jgi:cell division transport system permease protein